MGRLAVIALILYGAPAAHATLHDRGGGFIYDDALKVTWLQDANYARTSGLDADGLMTWEQAVAWADSLSITDSRPGAGGAVYDDWRLASMSVAAGRPVGRTESVLDCETVWGPLCADNELSYMFWYNLGGVAGSDLTGERTVADVTLNNIQPVYWSGTDFAEPNAWIIHFDNSGFGVWSPKNGLRYAWAVRDGDVVATPAAATAVPLPRWAVALLLATLPLAALVRLNFRGGVN